MRSTRPLALAALSLALIAGCGDDEASPTLDQATEATRSATDTTEATTESTGTDDETEGGAAGDAEVVVEGFEFQPESITVEAGTEIRFENRDGVPHTVTAGTPEEPLPAIVDEPLPPGATATWTVDEAGTVAYFCAIHPTMTAEVVVQ